MTGDNKYYDVAIVGAGLAGLTTAIMLARTGASVVICEKERFPFHKVCGEYISLESRPALASLGVPIQERPWPLINKLVLSSPDGTAAKQALTMGGVGVSRYTIDELLVQQARSAGVLVMEAARVQDITFDGELTEVRLSDRNILCKVCCGAFGKKSNLDVKWGRSFINKKYGPLNNYIGIKYHALLNHPRDTIALHSFADGYCGISPIEDDKTCICYLTTAARLREHRNDIQELQRELLFTNPFLHEAFSASRILYEKPLAISQVSFEKKEQVYNHTLLLGDAAGMITPLCGNGMSMAIHAGTMAARIIPPFLRGEMNRAKMEQQYSEEWQSTFSRRLFAGRLLQSAFGSATVSNVMLRLLRQVPFFMNAVVRQTHGKVF